MLFHVRIKIDEEYSSGEEQGNLLETKEIQSYL